MSACIRSTDNLREDRGGRCTTKTLQMHFGPKSKESESFLYYNFLLESVCDSHKVLPIYLLRSAWNNQSILEWT